MARVLFSAIGTTDPVRGMRDGGMMHIMRHYRPEAVYVFLTHEMVEKDRKDDRLGKTFAYVRSNWADYDPRLVRFETDITDPSDLDVLAGPMTDLLLKIVEENPGAEILLNLSSGTPQMEIILAQMALDPRYPTRGIQIKTPEKHSGLEDRTNKPNYSVDDALELNMDEEADAPNRCCEPKLMAVRREAVRNQLRSLLDQRNYGAIAQMGGSLPMPMVKLARHLDCRSSFLLKEAEEAAQGLKIPGLQAGRGELPYPVYEMVEYFAVLKHLVYLKRYTEFLLRLNPFLVRLQMTMLGEQLRANGMREEDLIPKVDGRKKISPTRIAACRPDLLAYMEREFGFALEERDLSIRAINMMLAFFGLSGETRQLLQDCERLNGILRNTAAHDLFTATEQDIRNLSGMDAETIVRKLEGVLLTTLERYGDKGLKNRLNVYSRCDQILRDCL